MSWDIRLVDKFGKPPNVEHFTDGGTYAMGGISEADLNVTYNYGYYFQFQRLHGREAKFTIAELAWGVQEFGTERDADYWTPTPGNAGAAMARLLEWAKQYPDCTWEVD